MLDGEVYAVLSAVETEQLDDGGRRVLEHSLRDFRRAGVDRDEQVRERLRAIDEREVELGQAFSRGIRDGRRTTVLPASAIEDLPEDWRRAHPDRKNTRLNSSH